MGACEAKRGAGNGVKADVAGFCSEGRSCRRRSSIWDPLLPTASSGALVVGDGCPMAIPLLSLGLCSPTPGFTEPAPSRFDCWYALLPHPCHPLLLAGRRTGAIGGVFCGHCPPRSPRTGRFYPAAWQNWGARTFLNRDPVHPTRRPMFHSDCDPPRLLFTKPKILGRGASLLQRKGREGRSSRVFQNPPRSAGAFRG